MNGWLVAIALLPAACGIYAYALYPLLLRWLAPPARPSGAAPADDALPSITILVPAFNEVATIGRTLEGILAFEYPADRRQILVVSDASDDGTDAVVAGFAARGVELLRMPERGGKTRAENAAAAHCRGELVVTMDASIEVPAGSLRRLVAAFEDPTVGVASGRDVSRSASSAEANEAEGGYVGLEMALRDLETRVHSIVGASGCFFATRRALLEHDFPAHLSKDFAAPLRARRRGFRSVSVNDAPCYVRRTAALEREYRRKVRTMARGLATLWHERDLLNPSRFGTFAWMLWSHKVMRWLVFLTLPPALLALALLAPGSPLAAVASVMAALGIAGGLLAIRWPLRTAPPAPLSLLGYLVASHAAGFVAWLVALRGEAQAVWEPTRRVEVA